MKEITRIIDARITVIEKMTDEEAELAIASGKESAENVRNTMTDFYGADNVQVEIHDFVIEKEG